MKVAAAGGGAYAKSINLTLSELLYLVLGLAVQAQTIQRPMFAGSGAACGAQGGQSPSGALGAAGGSTVVGTLTYAGGRGGNTTNLSYCGGGGGGAGGPMESGAREAMKQLVRVQREGTGGGGASGALNNTLATT